MSGEPVALDQQYWPFNESQPFADDVDLGRAKSGACILVLW